MLILEPLKPRGGVLVALATVLHLCLLRDLEQPPWISLLLCESKVLRKHLYPIFFTPATRLCLQALLYLVHCGATSLPAPRGAFVCQSSQIGLYIPDHHSRGCFHLPA